MAYRLVGAKQCWHIINWVLRDKFQWNLNRNSYIFIQENAFENVVCKNNYNNVIMGTMASQITSLTIVYSTVYSSADQRKHQSSASLAFVRGIHRGPVNSPHKWPVTRKMFPFDDVIIWWSICLGLNVLSLMAPITIHGNVSTVCTNFITNVP